MLRFIQKTYSKLGLHALQYSRKLSSNSQVSVKAYYIARGIDINQVQNKIYKTFPHSFDSKSVLVMMDEEKGQYVSIFKYGSVVLFNLSDDACLENLTKIKKEGALSTFLEDLHTEEYEVVVTKSLEKPSEIRNDSLNVRKLDTHNLFMVSTVMAQTVALDYYAQRVDRMIEKFMKLNMKVEEKGNFDFVDGKQLYKLIASNSTIYATVLSKLGIFEGCDSAWESASNRETWEGLRKEFEVDQRFKDLSMKLDIVHSNSRFFLEMLQNQHSNKLEWIIIVLIGAEIIIGVTSLGLSLKGVV